MAFDPDLARARIVLSRVAMRLRPFTSDDLRDVIEQERIPMKIQAVGAAIAEAKSGESPWIVQVGEVPSRREANHGRKIDVYVLLNEKTGRPVSQAGLRSLPDTPASAEPPSSPEQTAQEPLALGATGESDE